MCVRLCTQHWTCESETLWRGWGKPPSFTSVSCVSLVEGITFQHCVDIHSEARKEMAIWGGCCSGSSVIQRCEGLIT